MKVRFFACQTSTATAFAGIILMAAFGLPLLSVRASIPGGRSGSKVLLPSGRALAPAGRLVATPNFAVNVVVSAGKVVVAASGASQTHSVSLFDAASLKPVAQLLLFRQKPWWSKVIHGINHQSLFQGMVAGPGGNIYVAGGCSDDILVLHAVAEKFRLIRRFALHGQPFPATQYPYEYQGPHGGTRLFYPDSVAVGATGHHIFTTGLLSNAVARINLTSGRVQYANSGPFPFQVAVANHGHLLVVSNWGGNSLSVLNAQNLKPLGRISLGPRTGPQNQLPGVHPTAIVPVGNSSQLWVACANTDVLVKVDAVKLKTIGLAVDLPYAGAPPGTFPDALAIHGKYLFAANSGNNDVAVFDAASGKSLGLIPTAWYPTSLAVKGGNLFVACAKGLGSGPGTYQHWIGDSMSGSLEKIPLRNLSIDLAAWTHTALADNGFTSLQRAARRRHNSRVALFIHKHIRHVVFILRENKTFDEDFGAYRPAGKWADPKLDLYNGHELPNLYNLAHRSALCVNFYVDGEVTAQGHQWTTSAEDSDFVQRTWPMYYSGRGMVPGPGWTQSLGGNAGKSGNGFGDGDNPFSASENLSVLGHWANPWITYPQGMFLFNNLLTHHKSFMDFGEFAARNQAGDISAAMRRHMSAKSAAWDLFILDTNRAAVVTRYIATHQSHLPDCMYIWLPDDHTAGGTPGYYTPDYYVANNDRATGQIIAALSRLPAWRHTLVIITEDDAQSGADHIDAHRSLALLVSPWIKPACLVTHRYSQIDLTRIIECVCHLPAMSQWDANGRLISGIWTHRPHLAPILALAIGVPKQLNPGHVPAMRRLRFKAGSDGQWLSPEWLKAHGIGSRLGHSLPAFTPTALGKIPGPEQMRQEWIISRGRVSYQNVMAYIHQLAAREHRPLSAFVATTDADDGD